MAGDYRRAGKTRTTLFRILTTLLDHEQYPAAQIAQTYAQRWQVEIIYLRLKVTLRGPGTRLRGQTPRLAEQEIYGLLAVYNTLVGLAIAAAVTLDVDPDEINFAAVVALARTATRPGCTRCGHTPDNPAQDLITAITAQPRNRTDRQRTSTELARMSLRLTALGAPDSDRRRVSSSQCTRRNPVPFEDSVPPCQAVVRHPGDPRCCAGKDWSIPTCRNGPAPATPPRRPDLRMGPRTRRRQRPD